MLRLLIIAALVYLLYRAYRSWKIGNLPPSGHSNTDQSPNAIDDVMVKDPQCGVYFPKRKALQAELNGEELFFCSTECREKFLAAQTEPEK